MAAAPFKTLFNSVFGLAPVLATALFCTSLATSCATPEAQQKPVKPIAGAKKPKAAKGQKTLPTEGEQVPAVPTTQAPTAEELAQFIVRAGDQSGPFTEADRQMLTQMPAKAPSGSLTEAAVAVGVIRTVYNPAAAQPTQFVESDLGNGLTANKAGDPATVKRTELELESANRGLDLAAVLENNQFVQTESIFKLTLAALGAANSANGDAFSERIKGVMAQRAKSWIKFAEVNSLLPKEAPQTPTPLMTDPNIGQPTGDQPPASPATPLTQGDVRDAEGVLAEAQVLADKGEFDAAIAQVARVSPDSPQYPASLEKLKQYSNKAVQSLRTKAAQAYTSAAPVNDPKTRATHLERAKTYLQEALSKYPAADQLATVRDNLAVITRDISKLTQDGSSSEDGSTQK